MKIKHFLLGLFGLSLLLANTSFAQIQGATSEIIPADTSYTVSFHRPRLDGNGNPIRISGTNTVQVENALSAEEINRGFRTNDRIVVRLKAPIDSYVYVVNNSTWDGATLVNNKVNITRGTAQDFIYRLTNNNNGTQSISTEELLFLIRRTPFNESEMNAYLVKTGATTPPKISTVPQVPQPTPNTNQRRQKIPKTICSVVSIFFPWAKVICQATGLGAASAEALPLANEQTSLKPESDTENMIVQFAFPVSK